MGEEDNTLGNFLEYGGYIIFFTSTCNWEICVMCFMQENGPCKTPGF